MKCSADHVNYLITVTLILSKASDINCSQSLLQEHY